MLCLIRTQVNNPSEISKWINYKKEPIKRSQEWATLNVYPDKTVLPEKMGLVGLKT